MYYATALMVLGGIDTTPLRSLLSKMVQPTEFGKIFTFAGVSFSLARLVTSSIYQEIYADTVEFYAGLVYLIAAGTAGLALVKCSTTDNNLRPSCMDMFISDSGLHFICSHCKI